MTTGKRQHRFLLPLVMLLISVALLLSGCQNYTVGWSPYQPLDDADPGSDPADFASPSSTSPGSAFPDSASPSSTSPDASSPEPSARTFRIWGETDAYALEMFIKRHPELDVSYEKDVTVEWKTDWTTALAAGAGPDVFVYAAEQAGWSATLDIFEDLSQPAYRLEALQPLLSDAEWVETLSFDRTKRVHLPIYTYPAMLFYRADILEQNGYPSEPDELATYLENKSSWLNMARDLYAKDHVVMEWKESPWNVGGLARVPFDQNLDWRMLQAPIPDAVQTSVIASREKLSGYINIWDEVGRSFIRTNRLVMFAIGSWGVDLLPAWLPEQTGLWRATRLPMGLSAEWGTRWMSMNMASRHKEAAWDLMGSTITTVRHNYTTLRSMAYPYFGGQKVLDLSDRMRMEMEPVLRTPLDEAITDLFWSQQYLMYDGNMPADEFFTHFATEIEGKFEFELAMLREVRRAAGKPGDSPE